MREREREVHGRVHNVDKEKCGRYIRGVVCIPQLV